MEIKFCCPKMRLAIAGGDGWAWGDRLGSDKVGSEIFLPDEWGELTSHTTCPHCGAPIEITVKGGEGGEDEG